MRFDITLIYYTKCEFQNAILLVDVVLVVEVDAI
jgi:hypothetical protein